MSDVLRQITTQPTDIPILGSDDGTYTAPGKAWDGAPVRSQLSEGAESAGLAPEDALDAEVLNDQIGRVGHGVATVLDGPAVTWSDPRPSVDSSDTATNAPNFDGMGNGLVPGTLGPVVAPGHWYGGIEGEALVLCNSSGLWYSVDGYTWDGGHAVGHSELPTAMAAGHYNYIGDSVDYVSIVIYSDEGDGEFRATDNFGSSFYNAGFLPASAEDSETHVMGYFEPSKRFFWCARSQLYYFDADDDLSTNVEWTRITTSGFWSGAPPASPSHFASSPTECAIAISGSPRVIRSSDGDNWDAAGTGLTSYPFYLYWSESHQLWIALCQTGGVYSLWTAPAGMAAWTERAAPTWRSGAALTPLRQVAALGRTIVLIAGDGLYASRDFGGEDGTEWVRMRPRATEGVTDGWRFIRNLNGALWAGHTAHPDGTGGSSSCLESTMSGVLPSELRAVTPW